MIIIPADVVKIYEGKSKDVWQLNDGTVILDFNKNFQTVDARGNPDPGANQNSKEELPGLGRVNLALTTLFFKLFKSKLCIFHSDQGFQYTNINYIKYLDNLGVTISHSRKANCLDNASCENFFSHLKSESLELEVPEDENDLIRRIEEFIMWYNTDRPQDKLKGMTPIEFRDSFQY